MDWFSWLSKTHLEPAFLLEYALAFSHNQLDEDDISYFNHEFLQSMGISIAKHRLEILKLARKSSGSNPMAKLIAAIKKTKRKLVRYVQTWVHRNESAMIMVKTSRSYSSRWKAAMMKRSNRLVMNKQRPATLLITNDYGQVVGADGGGKMNGFSGSLAYDLRHDESKKDGSEYEENLYSDNEEGGGYHGGGGGAYWSGKSVEEIKWDAMSQNLKPT